MFRITCSEALAYFRCSRDTYARVLQTLKAHAYANLRLSEFHIHPRPREAHTRIQIHLCHRHAHTCAQVTESSV